MLFANWNSTQEHIGYKGLCRSCLIRVEIGSPRFSLEFLFEKLVDFVSCVEFKKYSIRFYSHQVSHDVIAEYKL